MILTTGLVDLQIEHWLSKKKEPIDGDAFDTIASWFMTSRPGDQFSLIAHGKPWDPLTTALQIVTELKVREDDRKAGAGYDEALKTIVYLNAMMVHVMWNMAEEHYPDSAFTESE